MLCFLVTSTARDKTLKLWNDAENNQNTLEVQRA